MEFQKEALYWIEYFGLKNWEVTFSHKEHKGNRATCYFHISGKVCTIELSTKWETLGVTPLLIKKSAFHEVCELLLGELSILAENMFDSAHVAEKTHDIIRTLENTVFREKRGS